MFFRFEKKVDEHTASHDAGNHTYGQLRRPDEGSRQNIAQQQETRSTQKRRGHQNAVVVPRKIAQDMRHHQAHEAYDLSLLHISEPPTQKAMAYGVVGV